MRKLIVYLIRKRLGLGKHEYFKFGNQKKSAVYWFNDTQIVKAEMFDGRPVITLSNVSLNWILDDNCTIVRLPDFEIADYV